MLTLIREYISNNKRITYLSDVLNRFTIYVPNVVYAAKTPGADPFDANAGPIRLHVAHPDPSLFQRQRILIEDITSKIAHLNPNFLCTKFESLTSTQFPEKLLIQYDCGKLQVLNDLLRQLYADTHRVLLFTQMTRMLEQRTTFHNFDSWYSLL